MANDTNRIRHSIDEYFADMDEHPSLQSRILAQTRGEVKVKKKLSAALIVITIVVLLSGVALAVVFSDVFFKQAATLQKANGYLNTWSLEDKINLIGTMEEAGISIPQERYQALLDDELSEEAANRIADEILVEVKIAREAIMYQYGFTNDTFTFFNPTVAFSLDENSPASSWIITYTPEEYEDRIGIYQVSVNAVSGEVMDVAWTYDDVSLTDQPDSWYAEIWDAALVNRLLTFNAQVAQKRAEMERTLGDYDAWSYEDKAALDQMYTETGFPINDMALNVLPDETDISYEEALRLAFYEIHNRFSVETATLETWNIQASLYQVSSQTDKLWVITCNNPDANAAERFVVELCTPSETVELCARYVHEVQVEPSDASTTTAPQATETTQSALSDQDADQIAWEAMKTLYGFEDITKAYFTPTVTHHDADQTCTVTYQSNTYNPSKIGDYSIVVNTETKEILGTSWTLQESYRQQGSTTPWKNADLWSSYEYNQYAALRQAAKAIIEQAGDQWSMTFEQQAAYDALYREAGYNRTQYCHGLPSEFDMPLEEAMQLARDSISEQYGVEDDLLDQAAIIYVFDVSDEALCKWRFSILVTNSEAETMYTVEIDSQSGEIIKLTSQPGSN